MMGKAGSIASIASAIKEERSATSATNSTRPGIFGCIMLVSILVENPKVYDQKPSL
jgi:hypothetical protein